MTPEEFDELWNLHYPETVPISYLFKFDFASRWFRIHSLPNSKRYPDNEQEKDILLKRQNAIITDLLGNNSKVILVTGEYNWGKRETHVVDEEKVFANYNFSILKSIDLYKLNPEDYDEWEVYRPAFAESKWSSNQHDELLMEIANDNIRAFFVSFEKKVIIAPYDGGIDFVLQDSSIKNVYKDKYKEWLSIREDGL